MSVAENQTAKITRSQQNQIYNNTIQDQRMQSPTKQGTAQISATNQQETQIQTNNLNHLIFKQQYRQKSIQDLLEHYQERPLYLHDSTISIRQRMFVNNGLPQVFELLQEINTVKKLILNNNCHCRILIQISHVSFPNLVNLNLRNNNILSIECLSIISIPNLKILDLSNNSLSSLKSVRKIGSPNLSTFSLNNNFIQQYFYLAELHAKGLANINVEQNNIDTKKKYYLTNVTWYFKLESTGPRILISSQSMKNKKILCKLKDKVLV